MPRSKTKSRSVIRRRPPLVFRPWVVNSSWDLLARRSIMHIDMHAYTDGLSTWFSIAYSYGGKDIVALDWFRYSGDALVAHEASDVPVQALVQLFWTRASHGVFRRAHRTLSEYSREMALAWRDVAAVSAHCHYLRTIDGEPWPRGFVNYYRDGKGGKPTYAAPAVVALARVGRSDA